MSVARRGNGWQARYRDQDGQQFAKQFPRKTDAQRWLNEVNAAMVTGTYVDPAVAKMTVAAWCDKWITGYEARVRGSSSRQARTHLVRIKSGLGSRSLRLLRPSDVRTWIATLQADGLAESTVYALHARLAQVMADAVHDGLLLKSPCSRRTSPTTGGQRPYVATTAQVFELLDAMPDHLRPAVLLGAFAGLRVAEVVGLRLVDVDFLRGIITPAIQNIDEPLKTKMSRTAVPIPIELAAELETYVGRYGTDRVVTNGFNGLCSTWQIQRAMRSVLREVDANGRRVSTLPIEFRHHDLRHYFASLLIASGADVKVVQTRLRHGSAKTTLDVYGHMWPDRDDSTRSAVTAALRLRPDPAPEPRMIMEDAR